MEELNPEMRLEKSWISRESMTIQELFNSILRKLTIGIIQTKKELLIEIKRKWRYINDCQFHTFADSIISLAATMDQTLKVFHSISTESMAAETVINEVYVGCKTIDRSAAVEAWLFVSDETETDVLINKVTSWLNQEFPDRRWTIRMMNLISGKHHMRTQFENTEQK